MLIRRFAEDFPRDQRVFRALAQILPAPGRTGTSELCCFFDTSGSLNEAIFSKLIGDALLSDSIFRKLRLQGLQSAFG